jgi:hypothetical protein
MTSQPKTAYTFHKVREQCPAGNSEAWAAFLEFYTPLAMHLLKMYLPQGGAAPELVWEQTLAALSGDDFQRLRATEANSEREFLVDLRALLLDHALAASQPAIADASLDLERLAKLLEGLPLLQREMLFHKLAGYTDGSIEHMLRMAPRVAQAAFARLDPDFAAALQAQSDGCQWPGAWLALLSDARGKKQTSCTALHQFLRIHDGQVSWYDKEPIEAHVAACPRCLEAWAALREVSYWRKAAAAVAPAELERYMRVLPLAAPSKKNFFQRVFGQG